MIAAVVLIGVLVYMACQQQPSIPAVLHNDPEVPLPPANGGDDAPPQYDPGGLDGPSGLLAGDGYVDDPVYWPSDPIAFDDATRWLRFCGYWRTPDGSYRLLRNDRTIVIVYGQPGTTNEMLSAAWVSGGSMPDANTMIFNDGPRYTCSVIDGDTLEWSWGDRWSRFVPAEQPIVLASPPHYSGSSPLTGIVTPPAYVDPSLPVQGSGGDWDPGVGELGPPVDPDWMMPPVDIVGAPENPIKVNPVAIVPQPMQDYWQPVPSAAEVQQAYGTQPDTSYPVPTPVTDPEQFQSVQDQPAPPVVDPMLNWTAESTEETECPPSVEVEVEEFWMS